MTAALPHLAAFVSVTVDCRAIGREHWDQHGVTEDALGQALAGRQLRWHVLGEVVVAAGASEALADPVPQSGEAVRLACWCRTCRPITMDDMRFVVCPDCGNKRCPKAADHRNACTGSNEPGQPGSAYP